MKRTASRWIAAVSALVTLGIIEGARRPRYGGELRVEIAAAPRTLEPGDFPALLEGQVFETLVKLDERGEPQPWLAVSWSHDTAAKRWVFTPRPNVVLHNGMAWAPPPITVADDRPIEQILRDLARPRNALAIKADDGSLAGTGPFKIVKLEAGKSLMLAANEDYWGGRPFLDTIEVQMGRPASAQLVDFQLNKADAVEAPVTEARRLKQRGTAVAMTVPLETLALVFENGKVSDNVREAIALSIDRAAIHSVLLQKQGEVSSALLPQWLSGYSFVFPAERNVARAKQLAASQSVSFGYDRQDSEIRVIAERIAVNASEAGITMRPAQGAADVRLVRLPVTSRDPETALDDLAVLLKTTAQGSEPYATERALLDGFRVVPLFHLPKATALSPRVRNWPRLADVWLDPREKP